MPMIDASALPASPLDAIRELAQTEREISTIRRRQVAQARRSGATWGEIGDALGVSRQAAWELFAKQATDLLTASAEANDDLSDEEAMQLAHEELNAVRNERRTS